MDGLTVAQISDLHAGSFVSMPKVRRFVAATNALRPDITVITGDMFHRTPESARACADELAALRAPLGVYAIMGNHERQLPVEEGEVPFRRAGLTVLCNAAHQVKAGGHSLWIVGLDDLLMRRGDLPRALRNVPDAACKILLVHEPDFADQRGTVSIDLQLSGHTHGGQIRLPGIGPLLLPVMGRKYPMGLYRVRDMWAYTNRGLGVARPPVRFNCRPEITLFTLCSAVDRPRAA
jgi:predicted MPP superfamily phosphohydrolase